MCFVCRTAGKEHEGFDIECLAGAHVYAPFPATVLKESIPYPWDHKLYGEPFNTGVYMKGTGSWDGKKVYGEAVI